MDEQTWLMSDDPREMLDFMTNQYNFQVGPTEGRMISDRKLRLFACAACRQVWHLLTDERSRRAVEVAERYADALATEQEVARVRLEAIAAFHEPQDFDRELTTRLFGPTTQLTENAGLPRWFSVSTKLAATQAALLREIAGNPFRPPALLWRDGVAYTPAGPIVPYPQPIKRGVCLVTAEATYERCLSLTPTVLSLARAAYDERPARRCQRCGGKQRGVKVPGGGWTRCPDCRGTGTIEDGTLDGDRLAVLADALEEAGCPADLPCRLCKGKGRFEGLEKQGGPEPGPEVRYIVQPDTGPINCPRCLGSGLEPGCTGLFAHLRGSGPHVRGCFALDLILGKE